MENPEEGYQVVPSITERKSHEDKLYDTVKNALTLINQACDYLNKTKNLLQFNNNQLIMFQTSICYQDICINKFYIQALLPYFDKNINNLTINEINEFITFVDKQKTNTIMIGIKIHNLWLKEIQPDLQLQPQSPLQSYSESYSRLRY
jgi:hypothetical protein